LRLQLLDLHLVLIRLVLRVLGGLCLIDLGLSCG
jgi:hypothetical protein